MAKNGRCPAGQYYCYTDEKCKPIPKGFRVVGKAGMLRKENGHSADDNTESKKNGNGNGNGNGGNGNGGTVSEEGLRDWFGKSKSKDGKKGWVNVVTGDSCASDKPGEGVPKCVSSAKRASMSKKERKAAAAAKRREDPGQQQKSGAAKPTMVKTDRKVRKEDMDINEAKDKKGKGSGTKDACYHKVKSRYSVWPSAYASGALVKCRKVGAANWGNSSKNEEFMALPEFSDIQINAMRKAGIEVEVIDEKCWKGYEKKGMKTMFGKRYPNCVKKEEVENVEELYKGKHGQSDKEYADSRSQGGKMISGDSKRSGAEYTHGRRVKAENPGMQPDVGGKTKPKSQGKMDAGSREDLKYRKSLMKKEEVTGGILVQDAQDFKPREIETVDIIKAEPIKGGQVDEAVRTKVQTGNMYQVIFGWRGKMMMVKLFFPELSVPNRQKVADALDKMYPGSQLRSYSHSVVDYDDPYINVGEEVENVDEACWDTHEQRGMKKKGGKMVPNCVPKGSVKKEETVQESVCEKCGQSPCVCPVRESYHSDWRSELEEGKGMEGMTQKGGHKRSTESGAGLTQKGVEKYRRQNPGSKLKTAVTTPPSKLKPGSKAANRRKSFCARSRGWTGERGKAARRRWNC